MVSTLKFDLPAPDISAWRAGNTGTEGVWHFDSGKPGRNVLISALIHGNELCGAWALKGLLEAGVKPELEVFDSGDMHLARDLMADGTLEGPGMWTFVLGVKYGFGAAPETVNYARSLLPPGAIWTAFGIGRMEFPTVAQAWLLGGHVRVGMEDNIYLSKGELATSNAQLVTKARRIVEDLGGEIANAREARGMLGLAAGGK